MINDEAVLIKYIKPDGTVMWDDCSIRTIEDLTYNVNSDILLTLRAHKLILR